MKLHLFVNILLASVLITACSKETPAEKTQPGTENAQAVEPATSPEGTESATPELTVESLEANAPEQATPAAIRSATAPASAEAQANGQEGTTEETPSENAATATSEASGEPSAEGAAPPEERVTGPVAKVNGTAIDAVEYYAEVDKILRRSARIPPERMNRIKENILKRLIEKVLIRQAVQQAGVTVPQAEIDEEFAQYKTRFRTDEQFQNYLRHGNVTIESIQARIREKLELQKLLEKTGKLNVTDEELSQFYTQNERFYQEREGVHARHVLVKVAENAAEDEVTKATQKINEVRAELAKGTEFEEVARRFSEGPSAPRGGDLGFFGRGQMVRAFEEKAFAMQPNEVSEPIRTRFGFHIIQVLEKREARQKPLEEVKETIRESLRNKRFFTERRALLSSLREEAQVERIIEIPQSTPRASVNPHGGGLNPHGGVVPPIRRVHPGMGAHPANIRQPGARALRPAATPTAVPASQPTTAPTAAPTAPTAAPTAAPTQPPAGQ